MKQAGGISEIRNDLRENYRFTGARLGQAQNWYAFSSGVSGIPFGAVFGANGKVRVEVYIDQGDGDKNNLIFNALKDQKETIESALGFELNWEGLDNRRACRISIENDGAIESSSEDLQETHQWMVDKLLKFKKAFAPRLKAAIK